MVGVNVQQASKKRCLDDMTLHDITLVTQNRYGNVWECTLTHDKGCHNTKRTTALVKGVTIQNEQQHWDRLVQKDDGMPT